MKSRLITAAVLLLLPSHLAVSVASETPRSGQFFFGWASTSITPDRPVAVAGQYHTRISGEVHDPLLATALAIETRDGDGIVHYPVKLTQVIVETPQKVLRMKKFEPVARPEIYLEDLMVTYRSPEQAFVAE